MTKLERFPSKERREAFISCLLNTELVAVLSVVRRSSDPADQDNADPTLMQSLKSLRPLIYKQHQEWDSVDPSIYLSPFLDVIQHDDVPATATAVALSAVLKILNHKIFDERTPGAREAINILVLNGVPSCRLEKTYPSFEDNVIMRILQVLESIVKHPAAVHLSDEAVCNLVNACFQVMQQSSNRGDLLQHRAWYTMHEIIQIIFAKLRNVEGKSLTLMNTAGIKDDASYGISCMVDIFQSFCSLLSVAEMVEHDGLLYQTSKEDVQHFTLEMINSIIELSGDAIAKHPQLLRLVQDDLFHHLVQYGTRCRPLNLAMICSIVLNLYKSLSKYIRLQLEAFFQYVLLRVASSGSSIQHQEVVLESMVNFCRQPNFIIEAYVNYDSDPLRHNILEDVGKILCKLSFPGACPVPSIQIQAFEGMEVLIHTIADKIDKADDSSIVGSFPLQISEYRPYWEEKVREECDDWVEYLRFRKSQKRVVQIAGNQFNRDEKKGLEYLKLRNMVSHPPDPKAFAVFFRFTSGLDKTSIGEYLGDPDEFHLQVLREFTNTFEFSGMVLDTALRTYLASFRLPGESQKIHRIIEAFSDKFYDQRNSDTFATKDAVLVLCYSLIMLNTDQHNPQVKKKMTEEEFIRNNRQINGGKDLPREYLSELFHSIATNEITVFGQNGTMVEMNQSWWTELITRSKNVLPFIICEFDRKLGRDMFACIAGPAVASISACFEQTDDDAMLNGCMRSLISLARIAQYGLYDTLDELIATFSKYTTLLNPYATSEETSFSFSNDLKPRVATLVVFTIANNFGKNIQDGWRNIVDCMLKLKRLRLLPQNISDLDIEVHSSSVAREASNGMAGRYSNLFSIESREDMISIGMSEFEQNMKVINQCRIGSLFKNSSKISDESLLSLGRSLVFAASSKGMKFSTQVEEEEAVTLCWDLLTIITLANVHRFQNFWPSFHDYLAGVAQLPLLSPLSFVEKAVERLFRICITLLSSPDTDKVSEELIFKSLNLLWKLDKEILDVCCEPILKVVSEILTDYPQNLKSNIGWKSALQLLSITGRHPETYENGVDTLISLISTKIYLSRTNYMYCIDCAFGFVALKNSPLEKNLKILDLLADSSELLVEWNRDFVKSGSNFSAGSNASTSSTEDNGRGINFATNYLLKLGEAFRKTSLARREEIRNHAILALKESFMRIAELDFSYHSCFHCFNHVIFAMVDDLHEKMVEYSRRENAEKEMRSMERTLQMAMELLTDMYILCLNSLASSTGFRTFWLGVLRRMDTCMKADLGVHGKTRLQDVIPDLLKKMIIIMKDEDILIPREGDDLWEITHIHIQWIAPSLVDLMLPEI